MMYLFIYLRSHTTDPEIRVLFLDLSSILVMNLQCSINFLLQAYNLTIKGL